MALFQQAKPAWVMVCWEFPDGTVQVMASRKLLKADIEVNNQDFYETFSGDVLMQYSHDPTMEMKVLMSKALVVRGTTHEYAMQAMIEALAKETA